MEKRKKLIFFAEKVDSFCKTEKLYYLCGAKGKGEYQSGQMGQTVNLLAYAFGGSNPSSPTNAYVAQG